MARPKLNDRQREFIVRELACYSTAKQIKKDLIEQHDVEVTINAIERYRPSGEYKRRLAGKWVQLFEKYRADFHSYIDMHVPGANKSVRLARLERIYLHYEKVGNYQAAVGVLENMAKEMGNVHSNRRELSGPKGKPMQFQDTTDMTQEQIMAELKGHFGYKDEEEDGSTELGQLQPGNDKAH